MSSSDHNPVLESFRATLVAQSHLFVCGGTIPTCDPQQTPDIPGSLPQVVSDKTKEQHNPAAQCDQKTSESITIRYDAAAATDGAVQSSFRLTLPLAHTADTDVSRLIQQCQPSVFDHNAVEMSPDAFCTTFDPSSLGIVDTIAQVLLPSIFKSTSYRSVRAELCKLNVYSAPSIKSKLQIGTPRSQQHFGTLVVCLPADHEGGQLKVRHKAQEMTFDWGSNWADCEPLALNWAAFYSDCEHQVLEVTSGHRLTLTYNLYAVRGVGRLTGVSQTLDPTKLPLLEAFRAILDRDPFNGKGGTLGYWCSHVYSFNNEKETPMPDSLKGVDAVLWEVFRAMNLQVKIAPVIKMSREVRQEYTGYYASEEENCSRTIPFTMPSEYVIGRTFGIHDAGDASYGLHSYNEIFAKWGQYASESMQWLTLPHVSELQLLCLADDVYSRTPTERLEKMYAGCAILVSIPAME